jgi:hypothetical protein
VLVWIGPSGCVVTNDILVIGRILYGKLNANCLTFRSGASVVNIGSDYAQVVDPEQVNPRNR